MNTNERSRRTKVVKRKKLKVRRAIGFFTVLIMLLGLIPIISITRAANATLEVTGSFVNLRSGPGTNYDKAGVLIKADQLEQIDKQGDWYKVKTGVGKVGWVAGWLVSPVKTPILGSAPVSTGNKVVLKGTYANLREGPGTSYAKVATAKQGQELDHVKSENGWEQVRLADGRLAWVAGWLVTLKAVPVVTPTSTTTTETSTATGTATVTGVYLNIRQEPNTGSEIITKVNKGDELTVLRGDEFNWYLVKTPQGQEGWVAGWLIKLSKAPGGPQATSREGIVVSGDFVNVRQQPTTSAPIIAKVYKGQGYDIKAKQQDWYKIEVAGKAGWIAGWLVQVDNGKVSEATNKGTITIPDKEETVAPAPEAAGATVALDAGHGGIDPGAVGPSGLKEKEVVWAITKHLKELLEEKGVTVILTRTEDVKIPLSQRAELANREQADLFVSVHCNANTNRSVQGTSTYTYAPQSLPDLYKMRDLRLDFAKVVQKELVNRLGLKDQGVREANFAVLRNTKMPSILVETAYISNHEEEKLLADEDVQKKVAEGIAAGILTYLQID